MILWAFFALNFNKTLMIVTDSLMFSPFEIFASVCFIIIIGMVLFGLIQNSKILKRQNDQQDLISMMGEVLKSGDERDKRRDSTEAHIVTLLEDSEQTKKDYINFMRQIHHQGK